MTAIKTTLNRMVYPIPLLIISLLLQLCCSPVLFAQQAAVQPVKWAWLEDSLATDIYAHRGKSLSIEGSLENACKGFIKDNFKEFLDARSGLRLIASKKSQLGNHLTFIQTFNGVPIYGTDIKFNLRHKRRISSLFYTAVETQNWPKLEYPALKDNLIDAKHVVFFNGYEAQGGIYYEVHEKAQNEFVKIIELADGGRIIRNLSREVKGAKDSLAWVYVFNPDPLTKAGKVYGGQLQNFNDGDTDSLTALRELVQVDVKFENDSFWLENDHVRFTSKNVNFSPPHSKTDTFNYTRSQDEFEYANTLYHITQYKKYLESLGFDTLMDYQIDVDPRAFLDDNSNFIRKLNSDGHGELNFGYSGSAFEHVDDAEDADVVIHEYGHAISYNANENSLDGATREAIDEGLGDYLACGYSERLDVYRSEYLFSWDGHNPFWEDGRNCFTSMKVSDYKGSNSKYENGEIVAGMLSNVSKILGNVVTDRILFSALYEFDDRMSLEAVGTLLLDAEQVLYEEKYRDTLCSILREHEFVPVDYCESSGIGAEVKSSPHFAVNKVAFKNSGMLSLLFREPGSRVVSLYDMEGRLLYQSQMNGGLTLEELINCDSGVYILKIDQGFTTKVERLIR